MSKIIQITKHCITSGHRNAIKDLSIFFTKLNEKVKSKINVGRKRCMTVWALKCHKSFLPALYYDMTIHNEKSTIE